MEVIDVLKYLPTNSFTIASLPDAATDLMWTAVVPVPKGTGFEPSTFSVKNITNLVSSLPIIDSLAATADEIRLQLRLVGAELVQEEIRVANVPAGTKTIPFPIGTSLGTLTLEYYEDQSHFAREAAFKWMNTVVDTNGNFGIPLNNKSWIKSGLNMLGANLSNKDGFVRDIEIHLLHDSGLDMLCNKLTGYPIKVHKTTLKKLGVSNILTTKVEYAIVESKMLAGLANAGGIVQAGLDTFRAITNYKK